MNLKVMKTQQLGIYLHNLYEMEDIIIDTVHKGKHCTQKEKIFHGNIFQ